VQLELNDEGYCLRAWFCRDFFLSGCCDSKQHYIIYSCCFLAFFTLSKHLVNSCSFWFISKPSTLLASQPVLFLTLKNHSLNSFVVHCNFVGNFQVDHNSDDFNIFVKAKDHLVSQYVLNCLVSCVCSVGRVSSELRNEYV